MQHLMKSAALLFGLLLVLPAWPQDQPEVTSHEGAVTFSSKVNMVSVPVVVRDAEGRALGNLKQEDFQLFDKGKLQVISRFSIEKTEKTEAAAVDSQSPAEHPRSRSQPPQSPRCPSATSLTWSTTSTCGPAICCRRIRR